MGNRSKARSEVYFRRIKTRPNIKFWDKLLDNGTTKSHGFKAQVERNVKEASR